MKIGLISNTRSMEAMRIARKVAMEIMKTKITVIVEEELAGKIGWKWGREKLERMNVDIIVIVGGDGTVLKTTRLLQKSETPVLVVNAGTVGFLSEINHQEICTAINMIRENKFKLETCTRIKAKINSEEVTDALNEITIITSKPVKVLNLEIIKDEEIVFSGRTDGIIIATRIGSTAYALSAGGPIIDPELDALVIVPVCPLKIYQKPIVMPIKAKIKVKVKEKGANALIVADGQVYREAPVNSMISIEKSDRKTIFIRLRKNFYEKLKERLIKDV